jgi:hypothetical protein
MGRDNFPQNLPWLTTGQDLVPVAAKTAMPINDVETASSTEMDWRHRMRLESHRMTPTVLGNPEENRNRDMAANLRE